MKFLPLLAVAGVLLISACETTEPSNKSAAANGEEKYVPIGTMIARTKPNRAERATAVDIQALDNDRTMGGTNTDGRHP